MSLISAVLGFLLRKAGLFVALVLSLFVAVLVISALVPALQQAEADRDRLVQVAAERAALAEELTRLETAYEAGQSTAVASLRAQIADEVAAGRREVAGLQGRVRALEAGESEACGFLTSLPEKVLPGPDPCRLAKERLEAARASLRTFQSNLGEARAEAAVLTDPTLSNEQKLQRLTGNAGRSDLQRDLENTRADLERVETEQQSLEERRDGWAGWVVGLWADSWRWLALAAALILLAPPLFRVLAYYLLMPLVQRVHTPIHLADDEDAASATLRCSDAVRTLVVPLDPGEVLSARSEHVRPVQGSLVRSQILYDWGSPFVSFAAGLFGLSRITGGDQPTEATLAPPDAPDAYLMRVDFTDHPGVAMHPRHIVALLGEPEVRTRWRWGIQALATGQVRHIMFAGSGSLIVQGVGDVQATRPVGDAVRMDQDLVMGFDSRLRAGVYRTDVFLPYLRGKRPLIDHRFSGEAPFFWQKSVGEDSQNPLVRTFNAFFSGLGKVLGF